MATQAQVTKELWQNLFEALKKFAVVQEEHLQRISTADAFDIMARRQEREKVFALVKQSGIDDLATHEGRDFLVINQVKEKIKQLLDGEEKLSKAVLSMRLNLKEKQGMMRKGKRSLIGYKMNKCSVRPRFLSSKS